jgi:glycosyltransferase involved in cell wall biosynthesis
MSSQVSSTKSRVFWLGMHKILTHTELPRLRQLGYEVFNPPYLSNVYDQSANLHWNAEQPTTLPPDVFKKLSTYNFFYNAIAPDIAELLNEYFDAAIVTISPTWLSALMRVFKKKLIYRTYGQTYQVCAHLVGEKVWLDILENDKFHVVPFAEETLVCEHRWFVDRCTIIPYTLSEDVFPLENTWGLRGINDELIVSVPNIRHPYYGAMYEHLNVHFPGPHLRMYGVQPEPLNDVRVAGTLPREEVLRTFQRAAGYFYPYHDANVCYLPPIEMMTIGGPVVYVEGSLLHRFFKGRTPGLARGLDEQRKMLDRLRARDRVLIREIITSQREIYERYHPRSVNPIFDAAFQRLLDSDPPQSRFESAGGRIAVTGHSRRSEEIWLLCHWPGHMIHEHVATGSMYALDGISRVITKVIAALLATTDYTLVATCYSYQAPIMTSYFYSHLKAGRMQLYILDPGNLYSSTGEMKGRFDRDDILAFVLSRQFRPKSAEEAGITTAAIQVAGRLRLAAELNSRAMISAVFVPHYYHFSEACLVQQKMVFYVPDYMPHFYPGIAFEGDLARDAENAAMGRAIADRASAVLVNSVFTANYLPDSDLKVAKEKIRLAPMPLLNGELPVLSEDDYLQLEHLTGNRPYLFYPTANRPNKELSFLLHVFHESRKQRPELRLVLTCNLSDYKPVEDTANQLGLSYLGDPHRADIILLPGATESRLRWLYEHAEAICFTSTMEGNFPPQIIEAMHYGTPVVATRLQHIVDVLGEDTDYLLLCSSKHLPDFISNLRLVFRSRDVVLDRQRLAARQVFRWNNRVAFEYAISQLFQEVAGGRCGHVPAEPHIYGEDFLPFGLLARVRRALADSLSDHDFSYRVHDLILRRTPQSQIVDKHVDILSDGTSREELLIRILGSCDEFEWQDEDEVTYVRQELSKGIKARRGWAQVSA